jgi:polysaccharide biosynthesis/export protein
MRDFFMKTPSHCHLPWRVAAIIVGCSVVLTSVRADEKSGTRPAPRQVAANLSLGEPEIAKTARAPAVASIEGIQTTTLGHEVQVRVIGSGELSCSPFSLADPIRLVLDCAAHAHARSTAAGAYQSPVRSIRVSQFKTDVARVVVDLKTQSPYSIRRDGNSVVVTFSPNPRQPSTTESGRKQTEPAPRAVEEKQDPVPGPAVQTQPGNAPPVKSEEPSPTNVGDLGHAEKLAQNNVTPIPEQTPAAVGSTDLKAPDASATERDSPVENFDPSSTDQDYVIGVQDVLAINVWRDPEISRSVPVRPDGKISLPLIGDLHVSGLTPRMLQDRLTKELDAYIRKPKVTVIVQEMNSRKFYIMGMVERPGAFPLATHVTVLDALAMSGGFRDFAKVNQIYLLHLMPDGSRKRIPFDFKKAVLGNNTYRDIEIQPSDTLVVP